MSAPVRALTLQDCPLPLGLAVSGGSDSTALLVRAAHVLPRDQLHVATVDHGLRAEAADEAAQVGALCTHYGLPHTILKIDLSKGPNLQARARAARYEALSAWAQAQGLAGIALGHTMDDQAETVLMRLARGSGVDGLAAMAADTDRAGQRYVRPLLGQRRDDLRAWLRSRSIPWSDDPSNDDAGFDRIALRQKMPELAELGLTTQRLSETAAWMQAASVVLEQAADDWCTQHVRAEHSDALIDRQALANGNDETAFRVLARLLCAISGNPLKPRFDPLMALRAGQSGTLHGCRAYVHKGTLRITREYEAVKTAPDPRWSIAGANGDLRALGEDGLSQVPNWRDTAVLPRISLLSSPSLWIKDTLVAAPLAAPQDGITCTLPNPLGAAK